MELEDKIRRSEDIQDIIGKVPSWIVRSGSIVVFIFFCLLLLVGFLVKYPDVVPGKIIITCPNPPVDLTSRSAGRIRFLVKENQLVNENDYVAIIENTAELREVISFQENLNNVYTKFSSDPYSHLQEDIPLQYTNLGEIQESFNVFKLAIDEYRLFFQIKYNTEKIKGYTFQLKHLSNENDLLETKKKVLFREYEIFQRQYNADKRLFAGGTISQTDMDKSENQLNQGATNIHQIEEDILNNIKTTDEIKAKINELLISDKDQIARMDFKVKVACKNLHNALLNWEKKYALVAPVRGNVSFYEYWNDNQFIKEGNEVAHIVSGTSKVFGKLYTKGKKMGKVKIGQKVRLKLDNYPSSEYGVVFGVVESISAVNKDNTYLVNVSLPNGLITNYHEKISFSHDMSGEGEIITDKLSIIERFFYQTRKVYSNNL